MATELPGYRGSLINAVPGRRSIHPVWLVLCGALAAGLALWSLYVVGLVFLMLAAIVIGGAPKSRRWRVATLIAMLGGFEAAMATLTTLYWFAWDQRDGGFYLYLLVLAAAGATILSLVLLATSRKAIPRHR
jgi:hypothetical protein